jgi:uncharacterized protein
VHIEQVMFRSGQVRCAGDLYLPDGVDDLAPAPAVVMGHSVTTVKEALAPHAEYLVRAGFVALAIDYRTIGSSEGQPRCQWLPEQQVQDMRAGLSYLRTRSEAVRAMLEQDAQRRLDTGEGATVPALASNDPKLAGYVAQAEELFPTFRNQMTLESLDHVLLWALVHFIRRLAPTPLLLVTGVDDPVHAIDEVLEAYDRALEPKRLELLVVDELGLSIEPGLGQSMNLAAGFFDQHLRRAPRFVPSPTPEEARQQGLRPEYHTAGGVRAAS